MPPYKLTLEQRIFAYDTYLKTKSCREVCKLFEEKFPGVPIPHRDTVRKLVLRFRETGSIHDRIPNRKRRVLTEEKLDDIGETLERSPKKSLLRISQEIGISKSSAHRATKLLKLRPYRVLVVQELQPLDDVSRVTFCNWVLRNISNPQLIIFSDEAWFHLHGYAYSQNYRPKNTKNSRLIRQIPLHDEKIGVWCAVTARRIIGPIFFQYTVNSERYRTEILAQFFEQLSDNERQHGYFQQDSAIAHTARDSLEALKEVFDDRIISRGLWPSRSPDLTSCNNYLWGTLKCRVYRNNPHTIDELKDNIRKEIRRISEADLLRVNDNFIKRYHECLNACTPL